MNKKFRSTVSILLILLSIFYSVAIKSHIASAAEASFDNSDVHLILDSVHYTEIPENFRTTSNLKNIQDKNINLSGLDKLNISGSHQFSEYNLPLLLKSIGTSLPLTVVDLRQESHGFVNGLPVSWANDKNNANEGLTREEVIEKENTELNSIKLNVPITFFNQPKITVVPTKVETEDKLVTSNSLSYVRIPVTDTKMPTDDMIDYFIEFVKSQPKDTWIHFHCKHGVGRTTTFMTMYDMIKNYKDVSSNDIIQRQLILGNLTQTINPVFDKDGVQLLENFYKYCKENGDTFNVKWSDWKKTISTKSNSFFPIASLSNSTSTSYYIKNSKIPTCLYVISQDAMSPSERTMIATLLLNSIYIFIYIQI